MSATTATTATSAATRTTVPTHRGIRSRQAKSLLATPTITYSLYWTRSGASEIRAWSWPELTSLVCGSIETEFRLDHFPRDVVALRLGSPQLGPVLLFLSRIYRGVVIIHAHDDSHP